MTVFVDPDAAAHLNDLRGWVELASASKRLDQDLFQGGRVLGRLLEIGITSATIDAIRDAIATDSWDDALDAFGRERDQKFSLFIGHMRAFEGEAVAPGMLLLHKHADASSIVRCVEAGVPELSERLGLPCGFRGRYVEFYDVLVASGPFVCRALRNIAFFTPFYAGKWSDLAQRYLLRRTIIFSNFARRRFTDVTAPALQRVAIAPSMLFTAERDALDRAIALWLCLHELLHESGPLPLFDARIGKLDIPEYGAIEEFRVDLTAWLALRRARDLFPREAEIAGNLIVWERMLRSARHAVSDGAFLPSGARAFEGEMGALWLGLAALSQGLDLRGSRIAVDCDALEERAIVELATLYQVEAAASENPEEGPRLLRESAGRFRERILGAASLRARELSRLLNSICDLPIDAPISSEECEAQK